MTTAPDRSIDLVDLAATAFTRYRADDTSLMSDLVDQVTPVLWHLARGQGLTADAAEDVVQQAWLRLVEQADRIVDPRSVLKWLMTTTRREAWRLARRAQREAPVTDLPGPPADPDDEVGDRVASHVEEDILWQHVSRLSERCRHLLRVIAFAAQPNYAEIAETLGMPVGSIGPTRGRCLATLRAALVADPAYDLGGSDER